MKQKKALFIPTHRKLFFAERVAVLRSLTATLDRERNEAFAKWREGTGACNGNRRSEAIAEQNKHISPFRAFLLRLMAGGRATAKTQGATDTIRLNEVERSVTQ